MITSDPRVREYQIQSDLERWPARTRQMILSNDALATKVLAAYRNHVYQGDFDQLDLFVDPTKVAVDVGTNYGQYALKLATLATGCLCIEPVKALRALEALLPDNCVFRNVAAGRTRATTILRIPRRDGLLFEALSTMATDNLLPGFQIEEQLTEVVTVDELVEEAFPTSKVGFIKIDVEGLEDEVLEGCVRTIHGHRPNLQIECHGDESVAVVCGYLRELGYRGLFFFEHQIMDASGFVPEVHRAPENEWGSMTARGLEFDSSRYVCDFYFVPVSG